MNRVRYIGKDRPLKNAPRALNPQEKGEKEEGEWNASVKKGRRGRNSGTFRSEKEGWILDTETECWFGKIRELGLS